MMHPPLIVYYDGQCGFCTRSMQRWRARDRRGRIQWRNVHESAAELTARGVTMDAARARLHAIDARGRVASGAGAVAGIWDQLPLYRPLAILARLAVARAAAAAVYNWVARNRGKW